MSGLWARVRRCWSRDTAVICAGLAGVFGGLTVTVAVAALLEGM